MTEFKWTDGPFFCKFGEPDPTEGHDPYNHVGRKMKAVEKSITDGESHIYTDADASEILWAREMEESSLLNPVHEWKVYE